MAGNSSIESSQTVTFTDNLSFDGTDRGGAMIADGQLWIGSATANRPNDGGHVRLGSITAADPSISVINGPGSIALRANGVAFSDITGDTGVTVGGSVKLYGHTGSANAGSTVGFNGSSSTEMDLFVSDDDDNTLIGKSAGNATLSGSANIGLGNDALHNLTLGGSNVMVGVNAGFVIADGGFNCGLGNSVLFSCTSGVGNIAIGDSSLQAVITGGENTCIGQSSGAHILGSSNVCVGWATLGTGKGSNNIALGSQAATSYAGTEGSNIIIGNTGTVSENNAIRIGTQGSGTGQQNTCFVAGVIGNTVSNAQQVTINSSTGQLGVGASSGNLVLIQSQTASSVADLEFTSGITGFDNYILSFYGVIISDDAQNVLFQCSTDGGSTYDASNYNQIGVIINSGSQNIYSLTSIFLLYGMSSQSNFPGSGTLNMYNINSSSLFKNFTHISSYQQSGAGPGYVSTSATYEVISIVNAFKISISSGTFSGTFKLYGVQN